MGEWFAEYMLLDNGYTHPGEFATVLKKRMIKKTDFPNIKEHGLVTPNTVEFRYLNIIKTLNNLVNLEEGNNETYKDRY